MTARRLARPGYFLEALIVATLAAAAFAVHDIAYMLRHPFWVDETWVAVTVKAPLHLLRQQTSVVPIGWAALLRLPWPGGEQRLRELPLCFDALAAAAAYVWARSLLWPRRMFAVIAGVFAGAAAVFAPAMLIRTDLKQFTADACFCIAVLGTTSWVERTWSRRRLAFLAAVVVVGMLFSVAAGFAGAACFAALFAIAAIGRDWRRLAEVSVAGAATAVGLFVLYRVFYASHVTSGFYSYWGPWFPPANPSGMADYLQFRLHGLAPLFGLGPDWLAGILVLFGLTVLVWRRATATAVAVPLLFLMMIVLGASQRYPLLDVRTSTFVLATAPVLAAIGVVGAAAAAISYLRWPLLIRGLAGVCVVGVAAGFFMWHASNYVRSLTLPGQDVRSQVQTVEQYRTAQDVILVSYPANWGVAYYSHFGQPKFVFDSASATQYIAVYPHSRVVVVRDRSLPAIADGIRAARSMIQPGSHGRIWIVRTDVSVPIEARNWSEALRGLNVIVVDVGTEPLLQVSF